MCHYHVVVVNLFDIEQLFESPFELLIAFAILFLFVDGFSVFLEFR